MLHAQLAACGYDNSEFQSTTGIAILAILLGHITCHLAYFQSAISGRCFSQKALLNFSQA